MNLKSVHTVYLIGIGGIGMSAIARYFNAEGKEVCGYDKTKTELTTQLEKEGISIHYKDDIKKIPFYEDIENDLLDQDEVLILYTPAIPATHTELQYLREHNFEVKKRSEILGILTQNKYTVAVAGTHGKTTTSSMIAHILKHSDIPCIAFLGGISKNYNNNMLLPEKEDFDEAIVVAEADEYDRSFLSLHPDIAIITSMDADHLDIYGTASEMQQSYNQFANLLSNEGHLIVKSGLSVYRNHITYSITERADYEAKNIRIENHRYVFDVTTPFGRLKNLMIGLPGRHNIENAVAALAVSLELKLGEDQIRKAFETYNGVKRRFEKIVENDSITFIDDYAHHPEEIRALLESVTELYPGKKILGIFQPHLFSRTNDFAAEFAESLSLLNHLVLLDIYPARELPIPGVSSELILNKLKSNCKAQILSKEECLKYVQNDNPDVLLSIGAGDIDTLVKPLQEILEKSTKTISR